MKLQSLPLLDQYRDLAVGVVKVTEGPFADFVGSVDEINLERGKLRVMVSIFGRPTAVELDIMHVTSI